jgi:hypothetical protein
MCCSLFINVHTRATQWKQVLAALHQSEADLLARYDIVVHLTSAAAGAREHYSTGNNAARTETPEQAAALDSKILAAWEHHHKLSVVSNEGTFEDKLQKVSSDVQRALKSIRDS